jgi:hypothetical protein
MHRAVRRRYLLRDLGLELLLSDDNSLYLSFPSKSAR